MVRIPLIRRQQKPDSSEGEKGNWKDPKGKGGKPQDASPFVKGYTPGTPGAKESQKADLPASPPEVNQDGNGYVLGTRKRIRLPAKGSKHGTPQRQSPPAVEASPVTPTLCGRPDVMQPAEAPFVAKVIVPQSLPVSPEVNVDGLSPVPMEQTEKSVEEQPADVVGESVTPPSEQLERSQPPLLEDQSKRAGQPAMAKEAEDGLAILRAIPDYVFRIGPAGVVPVVGNGSGLWAGAASQPQDAEAAAEQAEKVELLEKMLVEELKRQSEPHARKALETKQLQAFEFQVRGDKEAHDLEARLTPLGETEVLALVRDVTQYTQKHRALMESRNELEKHLKERNTELIRVNKMLKTEVELREEQEGILKKNFRRLESLVDETVGAITLIVERKDPHVADHQRRVCLLACAIAQEMNSRNDRMRAVRMAAQLHDLGNVFIPAEILRKPGKLTDAEMSVVKTHPDTDYQILKQINFPISIADVVRQHHERLDGSGYPQGLKGDDILIEARILAVADVIDGMVFERPYRVAPGLQAALREISENKGRLYDSAVADACLKLFAERRFQFEGLPPQETPVVVGATDRRDL